MITPKQAEELAENLIDIYQSIEDDLLTNIAGRFSVLDEITPDTVAEWQMNKLLQLGALRKESFKIIAARSGKTLKEIEQILTSAGYKTLEDAEKVYQMAFSEGLLPYAPLPVAASPAIRQIIKAAVDNTREFMNLINTTALQSANQAFVNTINQVYLETSLGITDYNTAMRKAVRQLADQGIAGATYRTETGRIIRNHLDVAVRRCIVTSTSQAAGKLQVQRAKDWGSNLVEVSSHIGARPEHAVWQGKIYSLEGSTAEYPNLAEVTGYGTVTGLCGANCGHTFYPFFEGLSEQTYKPYNLDENEKVYEQRQQQRKLERGIRIQKRRVLTADAAGDKEGLLKSQLALKDKEGQLKSFLKETGRRQRSNRQQVLGFSHSQASKAVWAKKKAVQSYASAHAASTSSYGLLKTNNGGKLLPQKVPYRFDSRVDADALLRPHTEALWNQLTPLEKESAYEYTAGSGKFNRPLRGYDKSWDNFVGIGKVPLDNEGAEVWIGGLQSAIDKSSMYDDIWLFRGSDQQSLAGLLGIDKSKIIPSNVAALNRKFSGEKIQDTAFFSTGIATDAGFNDKIAYEILTPKGSKGIYAEPFSHFGGTNDSNTWDGKQKATTVKSEAEVILQAGTRFEIQEIKLIAGKVTVVLKIL